jgi:hypothetical protein
MLAAAGFGAAAFAAVLIPVVPATSSAATATIGGYDLGGFAAPVTIQFYEPAIPVPNEPQGEIHYSFTSATSSSGPFSTAVASTVYPGPTLATGLPQFNENLPQYPVVVNANYPGTKAEGHQEKTVGPTGAGMVADAKDAKTYGSAQTGTPPANDFISFGNAASTMTVTQSPTSVTSTAVATVHDLGVGAGLVGVAAVRSESKTTSNGTKATASGAVTVSGVTVAGVPFTVDNEGTHGPAKLNLPPLLNPPKSGAELLKMLGIEFTPPAVTTKLSGAAGQRTGQGLVISIDTKPFKSALNNLGIQLLLQRLVPKNICIPDNGQLPFGSCLHEELDAILNLQPKVVVIAGGTYSASNSSEPFSFTPLPPGPITPPLTTSVPGAPDVPGTPGTAGTAGTPGTGTEAPQVAGPSTNVASGLPLGFNGLKGAALLGLLVGLLSSYLIRNLGLGVIAGFAGCEYGAPRSVPDLRRG